MNKLPGILLLFAAAACAPAQVTLSTLQNGVATAAQQAYDFGPVPVGNAADVVFRLTNTGAQAVYLTNLAFNGPDFAVVCSQSPDLCGSAPRQQLPVQIKPGGTLDFTARFLPLSLSVSTSSILTIDAGNTISTVLFGQGVAGLGVSLQGQSLGAGQTITFGSVQVSSTQTLPLLLTNQAGTSIAVPLIVPPTGTDFKLSGTALSAASIAPGAAVELDVVFAPTATGARLASLTIGLQTFHLQGTGLPAPPLSFPNPSIQLNLASPASAQQGTVAVSLASAATVAGLGTIQLSFQPSIGVADDHAVAFADGTRAAAFDVAAGESTGRFAGGATVYFGTGTTAGTLTFALTLGSSTAQASVTIPASSIGIDAAVAQRNVACDQALLACLPSNVELQVVGWDNTRTASRVAFTFFDAAGTAISPGEIISDQTADFQSYFAGSDLGGVFEVHALFPITGDSIQVVGFQVQLTNASGSTQTSRITF